MTNTKIALEENIQIGNYRICRGKTEIEAKITCKIKDSYLINTEF